MVQVVFGIILGVIVTVGYLAFNSKFHFDHELTLNMVIAIATVVATVIHFDSVQKQKRDRVWEINKGSLLNLSHAVADAIETSSKLTDQAFNEMQGIPDDTCNIDATNTGNKFQKTISESLNVYKPLLNSKLIEAIEDYQETEQKIIDKFNHDAINTFEAYELQWSAQKDLQHVIHKFIKKISGI